MLRKACVVGCLLVLAGCQRDFTLPDAKALALTPATTTVAPLEKLAFEAKNGTKPYTFAIATDGSGGATIDAKTGAYQAGPVGPTADVVSVTDASGQSIVAHVTVGPRLVVTPTLAFAAPGGEVALAATGGKPPYTAKAANTPSGGSFGGSNGMTWTVGPAGGGVDTLTVNDAVGATAQALVRVGPALQLLPTRQAAVAPRETLAFVATGGQSPYAFSIATPGSADASTSPTIDASGMYRAGPVGGSRDVVRVTDANGQTADYGVAITAALAARLETADLHPGQAVQIVATGGKPPYTYRFAKWGNHSGGDVSAMFGTYTPGWSYQVTDDLEVVDAVGVVAPVSGAVVGATDLGPAWVHSGTLADIDGDGRADLVTTNPTNQYLLHAVLPRSGAMPEVHDILLPWPVYQVAAAPIYTVPGDRRQRVLVVGSDGPYFLRVNRTGTAIKYALRETGPSLAMPNSIVSLPGSWVLVGRDTTCSGVERVDVDVSTATPSATTCVTGLPGIGSDYTAFLQNNEVELAWVQGTNLEIASGSGWSTVNAFPLQGNPLVTRPVAFTPAGQVVGAGTAVVVLVSYNGGSALSGIQFGRGSITPVPVTGANDPAPDHLIADPDASFVIAWNATGGEIDTVSATAAGTWTLKAPAGVRPAGYFDLAALGDMNGDGVADLSLFGPRSPHTALLLGDGNGAFGLRPRIGRMQTALVADVDGDGLDDVVAEGLSDVSVLHANQGALSWSPRSTALLPGGPSLVTDVDGDGSTDLVYLLPGDGMWAVSRDSTGTWSQGSRVDVGGADLAGSFAVASVAELGGDAPGPDFLGLPGPGLAPVAIVRGASSVTSVDLPAPPTGTCRSLVAYDANGDGLSDALVSCARFAPVLPPITSTLSLSLATATPGGPPSFGSWQVVSTHQDISGQLSDLDRFRPAGAAVADVGFYISDVYPTTQDTGELLVVTRAGVSTHQVPAQGGIDQAIMGDLDGSGDPDFVYTDLAGTLYVLRDATNAASRATPVFTSPGRLVGFVRLDAGAPYDVILKSGDDLVVLKNDGFGHLQ